MKIQAIETGENSYSVEFSGMNSRIMIGEELLTPGVYTCTKDMLYYRPVSVRRVTVGYINKRTNDTLSLSEYEAKLNDLEDRRVDVNGELVFENVEDLGKYAELKQYYTPVSDEVQVIGNLFEIPVVKTLQPLDNPYIIPYYAIGRSSTLATDYCIYQQKAAVIQTITDIFDKYGYKSKSGSAKAGDNEYKIYSHNDVSVHLKNTSFNFLAVDNRRMPFGEAETWYQRDMDRINSELVTYLNARQKEVPDVAHVLTSLKRIYTQVQLIDTKVATRDKQGSALRTINDLINEMKAIP